LEISVLGSYVLLKELERDKSRFLMKQWRSEAVFFWRR